MIKDLFPLKTFHQDAVLKRLSELAEKAQSEDDVEDKVEELVEGGTLDNAKPIYCHPLTMTIEGGVMTCLLFNNDSTPFTASTLADFIDNLFTEIGDIIRIMASGAFIKSTNVVISSFIGKNNSGYIIYGRIASTGAESITAFATKEAFVDAITSIFDGVNKIN